MAPILPLVLALAAAPEDGAVVARWRDCPAGEAAPGSPGLPGSLRSLVREPARLLCEGGSVAGRLWRARAPTLAAPARSAEPEARFAQFAVGSLLGAIELLRAADDARGERVPAGVYALRYAIQPRLKDHVDTTPFRDFAVLVEGLRDPGPPPALDDLVRLGRLAGGRHPLVLALLTTEEAAREGAPVLRLGSVRVGLRLARVPP